MEFRGAAASTLPSLWACEAPRQALTFPSRTTGLGLGILAWASGAILSLTLINQSLTPLSSSLCLVSTIFSLSLCYMLPETYDQPLVDNLEYYSLHTR